MEQSYKILDKMGERYSTCSLIRSKDGISVYRVKSENKSFILKVFRKNEDAREIKNYRILSSLGVNTLPLINYTENALLIPDVEESKKYRLGVESDMDDEATAKSVAKWYKELHNKGRKYLAERKTSLYDETDAITLDNLKMIAEKTDTIDNLLWKEISDGYDIIRSKIDALPRTLTYNDFNYTNLIVARDCSSAFMFDYNLLGKGTAYGDVRNVTSSLSHKAAIAFKREYDIGGLDNQSSADDFTAPLVALYNACKRNNFPSWAAVALEKLKNGDIMKSLNKWLNTEV